MTDPLGSLPERRVQPDARAQLRAWHEKADRRVAVLDDDPTGSQSVHRVAVVTVLERDQYEAALGQPGATCFILTNTRSLPGPEAASLTGTVARDLFDLARQHDFSLEIVSRSDSTLRGHVVSEVRAIDAARRQATGKGYDAVLFVPAFLEAGRVTAHDVHWARVDGELTPVGETEFARDASFGYRASDLKQFLAEKSGGSIEADHVRSVSLDDIRIGGEEKVAAILAAVPAGAFVVVNAVDYADLEIVALGIMRAINEGRSFMYRTGPSFVRAFAGLEARAPLTTADIRAATKARRGGHGLVVVGSHVGLTGRQVAFASSRGDIADIELDVSRVIDPRQRDDYVAAIGAEVSAQLAAANVLVSTSRALVRGPGPEASLRIARDVSSAVVDVVRAALQARPSWVIAKGGITSHDVAVQGLRIRRAEVLGQLFPGMVSVFRPVAAPPEVLGIPYVVFAGNVGDEEALAQAISILSGSA
jgi:uncharacterized protein YgbK (DUF1537 family)